MQQDKELLPAGQTSLMDQGHRVKQDPQQPPEVKPQAHHQLEQPHQEEPMPLEAMEPTSHQVTLAKPELTEPEQLAQQELDPTELPETPALKMVVIPLLLDPQEDLVILVALEAHPVVALMQILEALEHHQQDKVPRAEEQT